MSPALRAAGREIDVGLLAESLIYYDRILLNFANQPQLAALLRWTKQENAYEDFLSLVMDGSVLIYEYSFISAPVLRDDRYVFLNIVTPIQATPDSFKQRYLDHADVRAVAPESEEHWRLCRAFRDRVIEVKADQYGAAIENARAEHVDPRRAALIMQAFVDEVFDYRNLGAPPQVEVRVIPGSDQSVDVVYNVDFNDLSSRAGEALNFGPATPLQASVISNRLTWSAATEQCDLYLPSPISSLVADKMYEAVRTTNGTKDIINQLKVDVEFPDVRRLVNASRLPFKEVLRIRKKADRFRHWLQNEAGRDRDAIIAYHHEVAKESGLLGLGRKSLNLLGILGGAALGGALGAATSDPVKAAVGGAAGSAAGFLANLGSRIGAEWKPVVFGNWMKDRIERFLASR